MPEPSTKPIAKLHKVVFGVIVAILILVTSLFVFFALKRDDRFYLSSEFYASSSITNSSVDELAHLIQDKQSFLVFVSQPDCRNADEFAKVLNTFLAEHSLTILKVDFSDLKSSGLAPEVKFYPSFLVYHDGELVDFLDADSDDDIPSFKTVEGFTTWLQKFVILQN